MRYIFDTGTVNVTNGYLTWKIEDFFNLPLEVGCEITSPQCDYKSSRYTVCIWPRGRKGSGREWFGICLHRSGYWDVNDSVQFTIVAHGNLYTCTAQCSEYNNFRQERFLEWSDFLSLSHKIVHHGCLTIECKLPMECGGGSFKENDPMYESLNKIHSGDDHSPLPLPMISPYKICPEVSNPAGLNWTHPSDIETLLKVDESTPPEAKDCDSRIHNATDSTTRNVFWNTFTRGFTRASKKNKAEQMPDTVQETTVKNCEVTSTDSAKSTSECQSNPKKAFSDSESQMLHSEIHVAEEVKIPNINESQSAASSGSISRQNSTLADSYIKGLKKLSQCMKNLYLKGNEYDLTIIMEGKEFKVLKSILMERSPVFSDLLCEKADGNTNNILPIEPFDACDSSVFHHFLLYLYSGEIENWSLRNINGLYCAACMFEVPELKEHCMNFFNTALSINTITDVLRLVNAGSELDDMAVIFFARNMEIIMDTDEFKQYMVEDPTRVIELQRKALKIGYRKIIA